MPTYKYVVLAPGGGSDRPIPLNYSPCVHNWKYWSYCNSLKSRCGKILFQGPVWCGDNHRAARFRGWHLQRLTHTRVCSFNNEPTCMYVYNVRVHTYIVDDPLPCHGRYLFSGICDNILRAAGFQGAARFWGNMLVTFTSRNVCFLLHIYKYYGGIQVYILVTAIHGASTPHWRPWLWFTLACALQLYHSFLSVKGLTTCTKEYHSHSTCN